MPRHRGEASPPEAHRRADRRPHAPATRRGGILGLVSPASALRVACLLLVGLAACAGGAARGPGRPAGALLSSSVRAGAPGLGAGGAASSDEAAGGPIGPLSTGTLSDRITDPMVAIRHDRGVAKRYRAVAVVYHLDGLLLFARRLDRTRPPEDELPVFEGRLRPGRHTVTVHLTLEELADERLAAEPVGRSTLSATQGFLLTEGQFASVTARVRELRGGEPPRAERGPPSPPQPTVDFDIRFRPIRAD